MLALKFTEHRQDKGIKWKNGMDLGTYTAPCKNFFSSIHLSTASGTALTRSCGNWCCIGDQVGFIWKILIPLKVSIIIPLASIPIFPKIYGNNWGRVQGEMRVRQIALIQVRIQSAKYMWVQRYIASEWQISTAAFLSSCIWSSSGPDLNCYSVIHFKYVVWAN